LVHDVIDTWLAGLPAEATSELVYPGFWYVRIPGQNRRWIPIEIDARDRTVKLTSHVIPEPDDNHAEVYAFLLRHNHAATGVAFSLDSREGVICLVARLRADELSIDRLDETVGGIVDLTETTFRSILRLGFSARLRKP
jgi:hypothetical protein